MTLATVAALAALFVALLVVSRLLQSRGIVQVDAEAAAALVKEAAVTVIDVRTPGESSTGHLKKARLIPLSDLGRRIGELGTEKDRKILVYCASGSRSLAAAQVLKKAGFTNVVNLRGGIGAWSSRSLPLVR